MGTDYIFLTLAFICFLIAALRVTLPTKVDLVAAGLAFWMLANLL